MEQENKQETMIPLKPIITQLNELLGYSENESVSALIDDEKGIVGWNKVMKFEDGHIVPVVGKRWKTIKEMLVSESLAKIKTAKKLTEAVGDLDFILNSIKK